MSECHTKNQFEVPNSLKNIACKSLKTPVNAFDMILDIFNRKFFPEIQKNYLSHLKTVIEDIINSKKKEDIKKEIDNDNYTMENPGKTKFYLDRKIIRLFTINLNPNPYYDLEAETIIFLNGVDINFPQNCDETEKRILIAHELGHVFWEYIYKDKIFEKESDIEKIANIFATIALLDKQYFYREVCQKYTCDTDEKLIEEIVRILDFESL